jgi:hypothetical protein
MRPGLGTVVNESSNLPEKFILATAGQSITREMSLALIVYLEPMAPREIDDEFAQVKFMSMRGPWLLGVDCAHTRSWEPLLDLVRY